MKKSLPILVSLFMGISPLFANETISFQIKEDLKIYLIKCPSGEYTMGSSKDETGRQNTDFNSYNASINEDFYIGKYEVTQAQYEAIMGENPSKSVDKEKPVERVTYYNAMEFCKKLNEITKNTRPSGFEFSLPSELQWEYACRAGTNTALNNGKELSNAKGCSEELDELAWYKANSDTKTHAVGMKKSNNWGLYDMHGNVAEWCLDAYKGNKTTGTVDNDTKCAIRGGAYFYEPEKLRSASRGANPPNSLSSGFGFRVALVLTNPIPDSNHSAAQTENTSNQEKNQPSVSTESVVKNETAPAQVQNQPATTAPSAQDEVIKAGVKISVSINGAKFPLIGCPAGEFIFGSPENEIGRASNETQRKVKIDKGFYIGKYEITQGQYKAVMGNNPSITTGDKLPVHNINWLDAQKFCDKLNELTQNKRPANYGCALPTEEQWEYACRSGYSTSLNNGTNLKHPKSSDNELNKLSWYDANACNLVQIVGKKTANAWGIHDMLGNVWEWCADDISSKADDEFKTRIVRGGSYKSKANECRCANIKEAKENTTSEDFGFRIILKPRQ